MTREEARKHLIDWVSYVENPDSIPDFDQPCSADEIIESMKIGAEALSKLELPDGLEEAAEKYAPVQKTYSPVRGRDVDCNWLIREGFKAGAEWQREKDTRDMYMSDNRHFQKVYELGKKDMKAKMMEKAVETEVVSRITGSGLLPAVTFRVDDSYKEGDKVKIIVIKEEK